MSVVLCHCCHRCTSLSFIVVMEVLNYFGAMFNSSVLGL